MSITKNGIADFTNFNESFRVEPDNSVFLQVFHHGDPTTYKFASSDSWLDVYKDKNRWMNAGVFNLLDKWEILIVQRATETATTYMYRWVQSYNPNTATFANVASANITKNTESPYTSFATGGIYIIGSNTHFCTNNGTQGNWWGAIGAWNIWNGGVPAWAGIIVKDGGFVDMYVRIDNVSDTSISKIKASIKKNSNIVVANDFNEI